MSDHDESEDEIDDEQLEEYREMVDDLGTFPVSDGGVFVTLAAGSAET